MTNGEGNPQKTRNFATRITILYVLIGSLWILFSDRLMFLLFNDNHTLNLISTYKGWFYVLFTGALLFSLVKRELKKRNAIEEQLKSAKDKAEESEKLKTAFLNNISHHIRTPMNAIIGFSELIVDPLISADDKKGFPGFIIKGVANLLATIDDIIIVSQIQLGILTSEEHTTGDVALLIEELREFYQAQLNSLEPKKILDLDFNSKLKPEETFILADFRNMKQVLNRLLSNAVKYTNNGSIKLICSQLTPKYVLFQVSDTGCGIPDEKKDIVFNAFRQADEGNSNRKTEGSGLGLSIAKGLVELMNGRIWFESEKGKGSNFYFTIPVTQI
jgi:signal transduction histidine kinase